MKFWKRGTLWSTAVVVCMTGLLLSAPQNQGKENPTIRLYNEGTVLLNQGKGEEALRKMREVLRRDPNFASAYNVIGLISLMKRDFATAEENFLKVVSLQPNFTDTYNYLGILYRETGRNELARESFLRVVSAPDYPTKENGYFNLALLALSEKKEEEGLAFVEKAIGQ
ncbi:MAG TPA: tetratricopeptide repeat protein, partial [Candidatus Aminicenantes bacterium]|nr:tetratricopeptide repeat protein [Candidatus Aminicenantes bacterium]